MALRTSWLAARRIFAARDRKLAEARQRRKEQRGIGQNKNPSTTHCRERVYIKRETGIEPATTSLGSYNDTVVSDDSKALTPTPSAACTTACTSEGENANADAAPPTPTSKADRPGIDSKAKGSTRATRWHGSPLLC